MHCWVPALLLLATLAGCSDAQTVPAGTTPTSSTGTAPVTTSPPPHAPVIPPATSPALETFEFEDCTYLGLFLRMDPALVRPLVPDEFELVADVGGTAIVPMGVLQCTQAGAASLYGWMCVNIQAPDNELLNGAGGFTIHMYQVERFAVDGEAFSATLRRAGVNHTPAELGVSVAPAATSAQVSTGAAQYSYAVAASPPTEGNGNVDYVWRMITKRSDGYEVVSGHLEPNPATAGTTLGTVTASQGSAAEQAFGPAFTGLASYGTGYSWSEGEARFFPNEWLTT